MFLLWLICRTEYSSFQLQNLTPYPFPTREGEKIKASLLVGERFGERFTHLKIARAMPTKPGNGGHCPPY